MLGADIDAMKVPVVAELPDFLDGSSAHLILCFCVLTWPCAINLVTVSVHLRDSGGWL